MHIHILFIISLSFPPLAKAQENRHHPLKYRLNMNGLMIKTNKISFNVYSGTISCDTLEFHNGSDSPLSLKFNKTPEGIETEIYPEITAPGEKGHIIFKFDSKYTFGYKRWLLFPVINGVQEYAFRFIVETAVSEDFSLLSAEEIKQKPIAEIENAVLDFGKIKSGKKLELRYKLKNSGRNALIIRAIKSDCNCLKIKKPKPLIGAGDEILISAVYDSSGQSGFVHKTLTLITNDPQNTVLILRFAAEVIP